MKYQFSIRIDKRGDKNSAATKAVLDCNTLFSQRGYKDYNLVFSEHQNRAIYFLNIFVALIRFYFTIGKRSIVGTQYPLLNNIFKYFTKAVRHKKVKIFCIIHDIESLRLGNSDTETQNNEVTNLNYYDCLIVHNSTMGRWLQERGITKPMIPLTMFDYLTNDLSSSNTNTAFSHTICFAGNLTKSTFIYYLETINNWTFNVYGPNFQTTKVPGANVKWGGEFSPDRIVHELKGDFGLIWDGDSILKCDKAWGNYLQFNNPHKFSLYLAAGIPVIAPEDSAIASIIKEHKIGILVQSLQDLQSLRVSEDEYKILKENCLAITRKVAKGYYFLNALDKVEKELSK